LVLHVRIGYHAPKILKYVFRIHETGVMPINMAAEYTMRLDIIGSL